MSKISSLCNFHPKLLGVSLHFFGAEIVDLMALPKDFEHSFWKLVIKINFFGWNRTPKQLLWVGEDSLGGIVHYKRNLLVKMNLIWKCVLTT